ncbi:MAG: DUF541 domain-containing protein [Dehalococcoidia bacterium]|nr:MAG: DUF541 domain-containing protein [Dehalococcoidia bacterium]
MNTRRIALITIAGVALFVATVAATCGNTTTRVENTGPNQQTGITVSGEGKATGKPDVAMITLGVSRLADTVDAARNGAATSLDAMIKSMTGNGVSKDDIQTQQFNISPEYDYTNGKQLLKGFRVTNVVTAKLRDINKTSTVVDDAITAGGNDVQVQNIAFTIDNPDDLKKQAREAAVADAKAKAQTLASATGVSVGEPISITEGVASMPPIAYDIARGAAAPEAAPATPIEPGTQDVTITVSVTWSIQ